MPKIKAKHLPGWWVVVNPTASTYGSFNYTENNRQYIGVIFRSWHDLKDIRRPDKIIITASKNGVSDIWEVFRDEYVEEATDNKFKPWLEKAEILYLSGALDEYFQD